MSADASPGAPGAGFAYPEGPPSDAAAERMLAVATGILLEARERNDFLADLDLEGEIERLGHEWIAHRGALVHLEVHGEDPAAATVVVAHGLGDHARRQLGLATALRGHGFNVVAVDRPGHGLSEGRRGDAPLESDLGVLELALGFARRRSTGPVILLGDSLGGIMSWYLLTREPDVEAAVCHCIGHPEVHPDPSFRFKAPLIRALARALPRAPVSVRQIADYEHVALDPHTKRYFDEEADPLFNFSVTARSAASYLGFRPGLPWEQVQTPALVVIGGADRMVTPRFTRRAFERATPPRAEYLEVPDAGHQLFLDDLGLGLPPIVGWLGGVLGGARPR